MTDQEGLERELKLVATPEALQRLADMAVLADAGLVARDQRSVYYDTADLTLRAAGLTLRVRRSAGCHTQTLKAEGAANAGLFARQEWERALADDRPVLDGVTGPVAALLPALVPHALTSQFTVEVVRRTANVVHEGAEIEVVIDTGEIAGANVTDAVAEAELELKHGDPAALFSLARAMAAAVPLRLGVRSKAERGYALVEGKRRDKPVKAWPDVLAGEMTAGEAFARVAAACIRQFRLNEDILLRTRAADALHQARVAISRLRSALSTFKPVVADARIETLRAELRWLAAVLGEARDLDVLLTRADKEMADQLSAAREHAYDDVVAALDGQRVRILMVDFSEWIAVGTWRSAADSAGVRNQAADRFAADALRRLRRRIKRHGADLSSLSDERRHELRILAKKLRYATEFFRGLFTGRKARRRARSFLAALEGLQEQLGYLNDLAHEPQVLARLGITRAKESPLDGHPKMIKQAADAHETLTDAKPFWR